MEKKFNSGIFPGSQGGPLMHVIAAKAVSFLEAQSPEFVDYQKQVVKVDRTHHQVREVVFFDRRGDLLKTLTMENYRNYGGADGDIWRAQLLKMINHQTGKSTELLWSGYEFKNGYTDREFSKNALAKAR